MTCRFAALSLTLALTSPIVADWPQFRGPAGQGLADMKAPPTEWGPEKNVAWKVEVPGKGWSSPVVAGGRVYLTTAVPQGDGRSADQSLRALCLDTTTGSTLWDREVFKQDGKSAPPIHAKNSHASPTPVIDGDRLYVHFGHQGTACLSAKDGSVLWANRDLTYKPVHGNGGSPVVDGDRILICIDGTDRRSVVAFDKATGKVAWEFKRPQASSKPFSFGTPLVLEQHGRRVVVAPGSGVVNGVDAETGQELWAVKFDGYSVVPRPVAGHGLVYLSTGYDKPTLLAIKVEPGFRAAVAWKASQDAPTNPSPLLVGDELYMVSDHGIATCLDARTGKVHWRERVPGQYSASPLAAGGYIYLQNEIGVGTVLKSGTAFEVAATNKLGERTQASYAADGDAFLIRTERHLYRIAAR
ncbi:MAG TPA: PQQ-binding-like beta-propeller repeat protein [Fimbriiglobus sp.]|jgi:outer membrane protein assembly factor BamB|nr:PQQ-binding-like beta-propeller repeat protein [Fimbriiglobus sp.]